MALEKILNAIKMTALVAGLAFIVGFGSCTRRGEIEEVKKASDGKIAFISEEENKYRIVYTNKNGKEMSRFVYPAEDIPQAPLFPEVNIPSLSSIQLIEDGSLFCAGTISRYTTVARWVDNGREVGDEMSVGTERKGFLTKVSPSGEVLWTKSYEDPKLSQGGELREDDLSNVNIQDSAIIPNRGLILAGNNSDKGYLLRVDLQGNLKWKKEYNLNFDSQSKYNLMRIEKVCWSEPNSILFFGYYSNLGNKDDLILGKCDGNGDILWSKRLGIRGSSSWEGFPSHLSLEQSLDGGCIVAGSNESDHLIEKVNRNGEVEWKKNFDWDVRSVMPTQDGGYIAVGNMTVDKEKEWITALKINSNGDTQWQKAYKKPYVENRANCVTVVPDGYIIGGTYLGKEMLIKIDNHGEIKGF